MLNIFYKVHSNLNTRSPELMNHKTIFSLSRSNLVALIQLCIFSFLVWQRCIQDQSSTKVLITALPPALSSKSSLSFFHQLIIFAVWHLVIVSSSTPVSPLSESVQQIFKSNIPCYKVILKASTSTINIIILNVGQLHEYQYSTFGIQIQNPSPNSISIIKTIILGWI